MVRRASALLRRAVARHIINPRRRVSVKTSVAPVRGRVLLAYILDPFLSTRATVSSTHTHFLESRLIADAYLRRGFDVDVVDYRNDAFLPRERYDVLVSARTHLETFADRMPHRPLTIAHLDTAHYVYNNWAAYERVLALQRRRGLSSSSVRIVEANRALERATAGAVLGNRGFTLGTYAYAGKPLYPLPVPSPVPFPWMEREFDECRTRFLWMGSSGLVHKGLDLVLESFARVRALELLVCGPISEDVEFSSQFAYELGAPNVTNVGWVNIADPTFADLTRRCTAFVYPSCAEGQAGSAVIALHAGLIPIVSAQTGVDVGEFGIVLPDCGPDAISTAVQRIADMPAEELRSRSRAAWEYAQAHHTPAAYNASYDRMLSALLPD